MDRPHQPKLFNRHDFDGHTSRLSGCIPVAVVPVAGHDTPHPKEGPKKGGKVHREERRDDAVLLREITR